MQYLLDNKKPQIEMLTKNMKQLISEVKNEMRKRSKYQSGCYDLSDVILLGDQGTLSKKASQASLAKVGQPGHKSIKSLG